MKEIFQYWKEGWGLLFAGILGIYLNSMILDNLAKMFPEKLQYHAGLILFLLVNPIYCRFVIRNLFPTQEEKDHDRRCGG